MSQRCFLHSPCVSLTVIEFSSAPRLLHLAGTCGKKMRSWWARPEGGVSACRRAPCTSVKPGPGTSGTIPVTSSLRPATTPRRPVWRSCEWLSFPSSLSIRLTNALCWWMCVTFQMRIAHHFSQASFEVWGRNWRAKNMLALKNL